MPASLAQLVAQGGVLLPRGQKQVMGSAGGFLLEESVAATTYGGSAQGDICIVPGTGKRVALGPNVNGDAMAYVDGTKLSAQVANVLDLTTSKVARGGGTKAGTNYVTVNRAVSWSLPNNAWTTVNYDTLPNFVQDDGTIYTTAGTGLFTAPVAGMYGYDAVITFTTSTTGNRGVRWVTQGGTVIASAMESAAVVVANPMSIGGHGYFPAAYKIHAEVYQSSGAAMTIASHATTTPDSANYVLIG